MQLWWATRPVWVSVLVLGIMHGLALSVPIGISSHNWQAGIILGLIDTVAIGAVSYPRTARRRRRLYEAADPIAPERLSDSLRVAFRGPERTDFPDVLAAGRRIAEERILNADELQMLNIVATVIVELIFVGLSVWASPWWWLAVIGLAAVTAASAQGNRQLRRRLHLLQQLTTNPATANWPSNHH